MIVAALATVNLTLHFDTLQDVDLNKAMTVQNTSTTGLEPGDRIVAVDEHQLRNPRQLRRALRQAPETITVERDGELLPLALNVTSTSVSHWNQEVRATTSPSQALCLQHRDDPALMLQLTQTGICERPFVFP